MEFDFTMKGVGFVVSIILATMLLWQSWKNRENEDRSLLYFIAAAVVGLGVGV